MCNNNKKIADEDTKQRILIVDDVSLNQHVLKMALKQNYELLLASSGEEALCMAYTKPQPDLILLDVSMPGMDGYEACQRLKKIPDTQNIPIIFVTSHADREAEKHGFTLGAVDYIVKPISVPILRARVKTHLSLHRTITELRLALAEIKALNGLLPMCSWCRKMRDDSGYWLQVEQYLNDHTGIMVTHGICPECKQIHFPDA
ncbi:MAG: response regulator [Mariprofundales bacterium]